MNYEKILLVEDNPDDQELIRIVYCTLEDKKNTPSSLWLNGASDFDH